MQVRGTGHARMATVAAVDRKRSYVDVMERVLGSSHLDADESFGGEVTYLTVGTSGARTPRWSLLQVNDRVAGDRDER
jgi:hypothetical protein